MTGHPYTSADLDAMSDLVASPGYKLLRDRMEAELERRRLELEQRGAEAQYCRGQVAGLRTALATPQILSDEIKNLVAQDEKDGV